MLILLNCKISIPTSICVTTHPLTAPDVIPEIKYLLNIIYIVIMGINDIAVPASMKFHEDAASPDDFKCIIPTTSGMRRGSVIVNTIGSM